MSERHEVLFRHFGNHRSWRFHVLVVRKAQVFPVIWGWEWYFRDVDDCPAICRPSLRYVTLMHLHGHGRLGLDDALFCCCRLFRARATNAFVRAAGGVVSVISGAFSAHNLLTLDMALGRPLHRRPFRSAVTSLAQHIGFPCLPKPRQGEKE